jgi:bacteriorhodopsin
MKMKWALYLIGLAAIIAILLLMTNATLSASQTEDRIALGA